MERGKVEQFQGPLFHQDRVIKTSSGFSLFPPTMCAREREREEGGQSDAPHLLTNPPVSTLIIIDAKKNQVSQAFGGVLCLCFFLGSVVLTFTFFSPGSSE